MAVKNKKNTLASCQQYLKIADIKNNSVILKEGGIRAVIKVNSLNFDLKSEDEQNGIVYSYQEFLNTLEFPIQIIMKSKKLDIDNYLELMKGILVKQESNLLKNLTAHYIDYITKLVEIADIMQKDFYVVIPADPIQIAKSLNPLQRLLKTLNPADTLIENRKRKQEFESLKKKLDQRVQSITNGLSNIGLKCTTLNTYDLIELYYNCYNPKLSEAQKPKDMGEIDVPIENDTSSKEDK